MSKCHIVGNIMHWLICVICDILFGINYHSEIVVFVFTINCLHFKSGTFQTIYIYMIVTGGGETNIRQFFPHPNDTLVFLSSFLFTIVLSFLLLHYTLLIFTL